MECIFGSVNPVASFTFRAKNMLNICLLVPSKIHTLMQTYADVSLCLVYFCAFNGNNFTV